MSVQVCQKTNEWKLSGDLGLNWKYCKCLQNTFFRFHLWFHFRYMVDAADREKVEASRNELHNLLDKPQLQGIPVSVVLKTNLIFV